jgi:cytochrome c oxidase subunit 2
MNEVSMKTASLVAALYIACSALAPQWAHAQGATAEPPAAEAPAPEGGMQPAQVQEGAPPPAGGEAEAEQVPGAPPAQSVIEGTVEPAAPPPAFVMPELEVIGKPIPGGVNYQPAVTSVAEDTHWLSHWVHVVMVAIVLLVTALLAIVVVKFNRKANPNPARFTHNTKLEIAWTLVPVLILILIGSFSLPILFKQLEIPEPDLTIKATGNQWYWNYEYSDNEFSFDSILLPREDLAANGYTDDVYLLATDTAMVVPVGAVVRMQMTGADVIHSWTVPAFGVKMDAVPGRLNETWFEVDRPGVYFGQCSELCGKDHAFMPITVKALEPADYEAWLNWAIDEYGGTRGENVAAAE